MTVYFVKFRVQGQSKAELEAEAEKTATNFFDLPADALRFTYDVRPLRLIDGREAPLGHWEAEVTVEAS